MAVNCNDKEAVKSLIEQKVALNCTDMFGSIPLHHASGNGNLEIVEILLDSGSQINAQNKLGDSPIHEAVHHHLEVAKFLVSRGAAITVPNREGLLPVHIASGTGISDMVSFLISAGTPINIANYKTQLPIHLAAAFGYCSIVELLISARSLVDIPDMYGCLPIQYAANKGHLDIVKLFASFNVSLNAKNKNNDGLMHLSAAGGRFDVVKYLMQEKCDIEIDHQKLNTIKNRGIQEYISNSKLEITAKSQYRKQIFSEMVSYQYSVLRSPNIGFVNLMRTCKYPAYFWAINSGFYSEMICLVLLYLSVIPSSFVKEVDKLKPFKWKDIKVIFGMEMLMEITHHHLMHQRRVIGREIYNSRSLYDSEFATTAIEEVYGKRTCEILYDVKNINSFSERQ